MLYFFSGDLVCIFNVDNDNVRCSIRWFVKSTKKKKCYNDHIKQNDSGNSSASAIQNVQIRQKE